MKYHSTEDKERVAFEQSIGTETVERLIAAGIANDYVQALIQTCWRTWQVAIAHERISTRNERIIKIIQSVAQGPTGYNDNSGRECCIFPDCGDEGKSAKEWDVVEHVEDCPIILARKVLAEMEIKS